MYSVVLMAALAAGGQTPDGGCRQCYGNCYGSCYGNYGIDGWGCSGNSYTCSGGCSGACWGGCYGSCWGGSYGSYYPWNYSSCGCNGCWGAEGVSPYFAEPPAYGAPVTAPSQPPADAEPIPAPKKTSPESLAPSKARLIVEAPADATLYVDDHAMKTQSERRTYQTPELEPGQTYFYEVRVELERDGQKLTASKRVLLKAGQDVHADFKDLESTATARAK